LSDGRSIRPARPDDDDALWRILEPMLRAGETYALPRDLDRDAALAYWRAPGLVTAPWASGRGVARAMCEHSLDQARALGFRAMQFNFVVSSNERAVRLWQTCGFAIVGRLPAAFEHPTLGPVDALVMHRSL
jgi:GNAT superfamily N-acetyltransferase